MVVMTTGTMVRVTGARNFVGRILIVTDYAMIVSVGHDLSVTLRRDPASTTPEQWRYGKLPVNVKPIAVRRDDFNERLRVLEERTKSGGPA